MPGGPDERALFVVRRSGTLDGHFDDDDRANSELVQCRAAARLAHHVALHRNAGQVEGRIACGTYNDGPDITWTKNADLLIGNIHGTNLEDLHNWWLEYG